MKNIDKELVEWAVNKIQTEYREDVSLLIGQVGGGKIPTDEQNMVLIFSFRQPNAEINWRVLLSLKIWDMICIRFPGKDWSGLPISKNPK